MYNHLSCGTTKCYPTSQLLGASLYILVIMEIIQINMDEGANTFKMPHWQ